MIQCLNCDSAYELWQSPNGIDCPVCLRANRPDKVIRTWDELYLEFFSKPGVASAVFYEYEPRRFALYDAAAKAYASTQIGD